MISRWKLENFKSVRRQTGLDLGSITIFAGANSSGKSSVLQSILLISQTLSNTIGSRSVILNGHLAKLGQFDDLRSSGSEEDARIRIAWACHPRETASAPVPTLAADPTGYGLIRRRRVTDVDQVQCELTFDIDRRSRQRDLMQLQPRLFSCKVSAQGWDDRLGADRLETVEITRVAHSPKELQTKISGLKLEEEDLRDIPERALTYDVTLDKESLKQLQTEYAGAKPVGCILRHFLPQRLIIRFDRTEQDARTIAEFVSGTVPLTPTRMARVQGRRAQLMLPPAVLELLYDELGDDFPQLFQETPQESPVTIQEWFDRLRRLNVMRRQEARGRLQDLDKRIYRAARGDAEAQYELTSYAAHGVLHSALLYVDFLFAREVKYLGPLRDEPKPVYPLAASADPSDVGLRGEYTAAVLDLNRAQDVVYYPSAAFETPSIGGEPETVSLERAVRDWLEYFDVAEHVHTRDLGKLGHDLKVRSPGASESYDLTHVGVGVSQVLPILVAALIADADTTLIFEQPELHLHPAVQSRLADFFLAIALTGRQCLIETHSEYLVNRLRFRVAADPDERVREHLKLYFVSKTGDVSEFTDIDVNRYGAILDWPLGFFDQSQREAEELLSAASRKRKRDRETHETQDP